MGSLGFLLAGFGPYLLLLGAELHRDSAGLVWLSSAFGVGLLVVAATGPVVMRAGAGRVLRVAALTVAAGVAAMASTPRLAVAGTGALLVGFGGAALVLVTPALIRGRTAAARLTRVNGVSSVAGILGPVGIGALQHAGVPGRLALLAPLPALLALAAWRRLPAPPAADQPATGRPGGGRVAAAWGRVVLAVSGEFCFLVWGVARIRDVGVPGAAAAALSAAFPVGMAVGRLLGPRLAGHPLVVPAGALTAMVGTALGALGGDPWTVTAGLGIGGLGIAVLYPVTLAALTATPGLAARHTAALGASASGTAILAAPAVLAALGDVLSLRVAFLLPIPLLAPLLVGAAVAGPDLD
jgi:MFS family permease